MFEPAEGLGSPEGSDPPDSDILEQEAQQKEETQPSPESDKALTAEAIGELPKAENPVEVEDTLRGQTSEEVREIGTAQESVQERTNLSEEGASVVLTPEHIDTPNGSSLLTSTAVEATREREAARLKLAKLSNTGVERKAV